MSHVTLTVDEAHALVTEALMANRTSAANARSVADALIGAELCGQAGHGLRRVPAYAAQAKAGKVDGFAEPTAERVRPGMVRIDAGSGFAYPALALATTLLAAFGPGVTARFRAMAQAVETEEGARLPGRRRQALRRRLTTQGITADAALVEAIRALEA
ncbi:MAG TPA: Ldh family oxidoreductase [Paracoccaceae bacterium]|nr:Ldh family oxidoreductase [Paracoccaceae bacterium]